MDTVKINEIANEIGIAPKQVLQKAIMLSLDVKTTRSKVSVENAEKIFNAIMLSTKEHISSEIYTSYEHIIFHINKLNIYATNLPKDLKFLKNISNQTFSNDIENSIIFSKNFNDDILEKLYASSKDKSVFDSYINKKINKHQNLSLAKNIKTFLNNFELSSLNDKESILNIKSHIEKHKPDVISIEGVYYPHIKDDVSKIFSDIKAISSQHNVDVNISFTNMSYVEKNQFVDQLHYIFCRGED